MWQYVKHNLTTNNYTLGRDTHRYTKNTQCGCDASYSCLCGWYYQQHGQSFHTATS